jgi:hypothetical protein
MDINKSDFKIIYNLTKKFKNSNNFNQLINDINDNNVQNNNLKNVLNNNNIKKVTDVINKLNKFSLSNVNKVYSYNDSQVTSPGIPDTVSNIDSQTSIDEFTNNFIPNPKNVNQNDSETSYNIDYEYDLNTAELDNYNSETSETSETKYNKNIPKYDNMDDIVNDLLLTDTNTSTPKRIREKYNNNDIKYLLSMI